MAEFALALGVVRKLLGPTSGRLSLRADRTATAITLLAGGVAAGPAVVVFGLHLWWLEVLLLALLMATGRPWTRYQVVRAVQSEADFHDS